MAYIVTLIPGDGTGPEVTEATRRVLEATGVGFEWDVQAGGTGLLESTSTPLPAAVRDSMRRTRLVLVGPATHKIDTSFEGVERMAVFETEQDGAPRYAGMNKVDPLPMMRCGVLMLRHLRENEAADRLERAIAEIVAEGKCVTVDVKPDRNDPTAVGTSQVADAVVARLKG
jgi:isocitrate/isopropylmalate dehydrogenase